MPLELLEIVGAVFELLGVLDLPFFSGDSGEPSAGALRANERAKASADIVVLAAWHDAKVTEAERQELARRLEPVFLKAGVTVTIDELVERWSGPRMALRSEAGFSAAIRRLAEDLERRQREQTFAAVVSVLTADAVRIDPSSPYRKRDSADQSAAIRLFGAALGIPERDVEAALG